jgi:hypothetical protein
MMGKRRRVDRAEAERIGLEALLFLTADGPRLARLLAVTGLTPAELEARAGEAELHASLLAHLAEDESLLLVFAASAGIDPANVEPARLLLTG